MLVAGTQNIPSPAEIPPEEIHDYKYDCDNDDGCEHTRTTINDYKSFGGSRFSTPKYSDASFAKSGILVAGAEHVPGAPHPLDATLAMAYPH
jgi:hypothetical protein